MTELVVVVLVVMGQAVGLVLVPQPGVLLVLVLVLVLVVMALIQTTAVMVEALKTCRDPAPLVSRLRQMAVLLGRRRHVDRRPG